MNNTTEASNTTHIADDPFEDPNESPTTEHFSYYLLYRFALHAISLIADGLIVYAISKFGDLRSHENTFILQRSIFNITHIAFQHFVHIIWFHMLKAEFLPCYLSVTSTTLLVMTLFIPFSLFLSWIVQNFKYKLFEACELGFRRYLIYAAYVAGVVEYVMEYLSCHLEMFHILASSFEIIILCTIALNIVKCKFCMKDDKSSRTLYTVHVANAAIFSFLPMLIYHHFINYIQTKKSLYFFIHTRFIPELVAFGNSPILLFVLYRYNRDFNNAFATIWRNLLRKSNGDIRWTDMHEDVQN